MKMQTTTIIHFSPTGSTAKIANHLGEALAVAAMEIDLTTQTLKEHSISKDSFAVVAVPVYGGRVPARAVEALRLVTGNGVPCASIVVYGNRAPDDALLELNDMLVEQGFKVIASGSFVAQHSLVDEIAAGRPDAEDFAALDSFAAAILGTISSGPGPHAPTVPGKRPYVEFPSQPVTPLVSDNCISCGVCARQCPLSAIPAGDFKTTDKEKCILCMRCVRVCPVNSRALPPQVSEHLTAFLRQFAERKDPEVYF